MRLTRARKVLMVVIQQLKISQQFKKKIQQYIVQGYNQAIIKRANVSLSLSPTRGDT